MPAELRVSPEQDARLAEQAERVTPGDVVRLLDLLAAGLRAMKDGADARTQLELALVKAADPALEPSVQALLARIERLEGRAAGRDEPAGRSPSEAATAAGRAAAERAAGEPAPDAAPAGDDDRVPAAAAARAAASQPAAAEPVPERSSGSTAVTITAQLEGQPPVVATTTLPGAARRRIRARDAGRRRGRGRRRRRLATDADPTPAVGAIAVVDPDGPAPEAAFSATVDLDLEAFGKLWPAVLESIQGESSLLAALLAEGAPGLVGRRRAHAGLGESAAFSKRKAENPANRELIARRSARSPAARCASPTSCAPTPTSARPPRPAGLSEDELIAALHGGVRRRAAPGRRRVTRTAQES